MTEIPRASAAPRRTGETPVLAAVAAAHFVSHFYMLALPPLFEVIRADFQVSYTELGFALVAYSLTSGLFQTPAGVLVDRVGARPVLIAGVAGGALALVIAAMATWFWLFVAAFALGGIANAVYHPADYAVLSNRIAGERIGRAFAIHTFSGILGGAVAPAVMLFVYSQVGWRGAFVAAALVGAAVIVQLLLLGADLTAQRRQDAPDPPSRRDSVRLLMSPVILLNFIFFTLIAVYGIALQNYSVVALAAGYGIPLEAGNIALTAFLACNGAGVLLGGLATGRLSPSFVATSSMLTLALVTAALAVLPLGSIPAVLVMGAAGLANGTAMPSRDMLVRAVTPPGAFGTVFGFVTTGFNLAGVVAPIFYGLLLDHGHPRSVFLVAAASALVAVLSVIQVRSRSAAKP